MDKVEFQLVGVGGLGGEALAPCPVDHPLELLELELKLGLPRFGLGLLRLKHRVLGLQHRVLGLKDVRPGLHRKQLRDQFLP